MSRVGVVLSNGDRQPRRARVSFLLLCALLLSGWSLFLPTAARAGGCGWDCYACTWHPEVGYCDGEGSSYCECCEINC